MVYLKLKPNLSTVRVISGYEAVSSANNNISVLIGSVGHLRDGAGDLPDTPDDQAPLKINYLQQAPLGENGRQVPEACGLDYGRENDRKGACPRAELVVLLEGQVQHGQGRQGLKVQAAGVKRQRGGSYLCYRVGQPVVVSEVLQWARQVYPILVFHLTNIFVLSELRTNAEHLKLSPRNNAQETKFLIVE